MVEYDQEGKVVAARSAKLLGAAQPGLLRFLQRRDRREGGVGLTVQLLHCSDLHLDKSFNFLDPQNSIRRRTDVHDNFTRIVEFALKEKPDLFLMSGDIFDKISPSNQSRVFLTREVRKLKEAGILTYAIGGNHDVPRALGTPTLAIEVLSSAGLATVFSSPEVQSSMVKVDGQEVRVSGRSYLAQFEHQNPLKGVKLGEPAAYDIFMVHGSLLGLDVRPNTPEMATHNPFYADDVPLGVGYLALGHYHNHFEREHNGCTIVNPGSIERLDWNELPDQKGFAWVEMSQSKVSVEFVPLEMREMEARSLDLKGCPADMTETVFEYISQFRDPEKLFRLALSGTLSLPAYQKLDVSRIYEFGRQSFFNFDLDRKQLEVEGEKVFLGRVDNPIEAYRKRLDALRTRAETEEERRLLEEAKEMGLTLLEEAQG